jgi:hypothetical protein
MVFGFVAKVMFFAIGLSVSEIICNIAVGKEDYL